MDTADDCRFPTNGIPCQVVGFASIMLLSYPLIRFIIRALAFVVTTRLSALLYRGNR